MTAAVSRDLRLLAHNHEHVALSSHEPTVPNPMSFPIPSTPLALALTAAVAVTVPATVFNMFWSTNKMPVDGRVGFP